MGGNGCEYIDIRLTGMHVVRVESFVFFRLVPLIPFEGVILFPGVINFEFSTKIII
jgi:hypothetical protein